jgi:hypothetical protein
VEVAVVQAFAQRPPHAATLRHTVICRSARTANRRADRGLGVPAGWAVVGHLPDIEKPAPTRAALALALDGAARDAERALHAGQGWIAWHLGARLDVTFDDCGTWGHFHASESLPLGELDLSRVKFRCDPSDCAGVAMDLPDGMEVRGLRVSPPSRIAFEMHSKAVKGPPGRRVESEDGGRTWRLTP